MPAAFTNRGRIPLSLRFGLPDNSLPTPLGSYSLPPGSPRRERPSSGKPEARAEWNAFFGLPDNSIAALYRFNFRPSFVAGTLLSGSGAPSSGAPLRMLRSRSSILAA